MAKVTVIFEDDEDQEDGVTVTWDFDPPLSMKDKTTKLTPAQYAALDTLSSLKGVDDDEQ